MLDLGTPGGPVGPGAGVKDRAAEDETLGPKSGAGGKNQLADREIGHERAGRVRLVGGHRPIVAARATTEKRCGARPGPRGERHHTTGAQAPVAIAPRPLVKGVSRSSRPPKKHPP